MTIRSSRIRRFFYSLRAFFHLLSPSSTHALANDRRSLALWRQKSILILLPRTGPTQKSLPLRSLKKMCVGVSVCERESRNEEERASRKSSVFRILLNGIPIACRLLFYWPANVRLSISSPNPRSEGDEGVIFAEFRFPRAPFPCTGA